MQMESPIPKENLFFGNNLFFFGGGYKDGHKDRWTDGHKEGCTDMGGITYHMSTYHLSYFSTVQWGIGLGVQILFLGDEVQGQHGMTSWLPM